MKELVAKLESLLRLRSIPFGMKLFETVAEMEAIPKIRRPKGSVHMIRALAVEFARYRVRANAICLAGSRPR